MHCRPQFQGVPPRSAAEAMVSPQPHIHGKRTTAGILRLAHGRASPDRRRAGRRAARDLLDLFDEHTWSYWDTAAGVDPAWVQDQLKAAPAFEARELAGYVLAHELEALAGNPAQSDGRPDHVLFVNPSPLARAEYVDIPAAWRRLGPRLRCERFMPPQAGEVETCGPIELPAFGIKRVPLASLEPASEDPCVRHEDRRTPGEVRALNNVRIEIARKGDAVIESPFHRLTYDPASGRILGLFDKLLNWDVLPAGAEYGFFDFVRERPDALADGRREAYYERDLDQEKVDQSCWKAWRAVRERATRRSIAGSPGLSARWRWSGRSTRLE